jgi:hypothetical protein
MSHPTPAPFLPDDIRDLLHRKSSRDPASRFPQKLHALLGYADDYPALRDQVGAYWMGDDEFRMNKTILANVLGIKLNTLNVDLNNLHFEQVQKVKDGWSVWRRSGFTKTDSGAPPDSRFELGRRPRTRPDPAFSKITFNLGRLSPDQTNSFIRTSRELWSELFGIHCAYVPTDRLVHIAATRFKHTEQPLDNAKDVIKAIIVPPTGATQLDFADFCRFLAMFGPEQTVMLKISSLLTCSNATGKWLTFDSDFMAERRPAPFARFNPAEPNCLLVQRTDGQVSRVYNDPNVDATKPYLIDASGQQFCQWDDYFREHPVQLGYYH